MDFLCANRASEFAEDVGLWFFEWRMHVPAEGPYRKWRKLTLTTCRYASRYARHVITLSTAVGGRCFALYYVRVYTVVTAYVQSGPINTNPLRFMS